jgi:hypothetical protein
MSCLSYNKISYEAEDPKDRIKELKWSLKTIPSVEDIKLTYDNNDFSGHMVLKLNSDMIEPAVEDVIDNHDAWMKPPTLIEGGLEVEVMLGDIPEQEFEDSGTNSVRKRGGSKIIAIPPDAATYSDVNVGDKVNFYSRNGEILLQRTTEN